MTQPLLSYKFAPVCTSRLPSLRKLIASQFSDRDPVNMRAYAQALIINPEFSDLAVEAGFEVPNDFGETIYQTVSTREDWTAEDKINELTVRHTLLWRLIDQLRVWHRSCFPFIRTSNPMQNTSRVVCFVSCRASSRGYMLIHS